MIDDRRVRILQEGSASAHDMAGPVIYVMARDQRVHSNWALLHAQSQARERGVALGVFFGLGPMFNDGTKRHNEWLISSLQEVATILGEYAIPFFIESGDWADMIATFTQQHAVSEVIFDFNPLEPVRTWRDAAAKKLSCRVSEVDARNVVPCWYASDKAEYAAHTIRKKIHAKRDEFLVDIPSIETHPHAWQGTVPHIDWEKLRSFRSFAVDAPVPEHFAPGEQAAYGVLGNFIQHRLVNYDAGRNDPNEDALSDLSPYLRWGNISAQAVARAIQGASASRNAKEAFLEELIVRRELADNYVFYTKDYDKLSSASAWAQETLAKHRDDARDHIYTISEFEHAQTHDELWNAAQKQMVLEGKMHGYLRMYWAKKILEWTNTPEYAIEVALTLNDRYELDGRESNGVVGVMWSIAGVHDRAWPERAVYGKIRYMNANGAKRKFDVDAFVARYQDTEL